MIALDCRLIVERQIARLPEELRWALAGYALCFALVNVVSLDRPNTPPLASTSVTVSEQPESSAVTNQEVPSLSPQQSQAGSVPTEGHRPVHSEAHHPLQLMLDSLETLLDAHDTQASVLDSLQQPGALSGEEVPVEGYDNRL